jgi:putative Holliday junction resolvase
MPEATPRAPSDAGAGIVLGFDFGLRRIGVALGNGVTRSARALCVVERGGTRPAEAHWAELAALLAQWQPGLLVVGVARHPDGVAHEMTRQCERFARQLAGRFGLPVARVDERYTTAVLDPRTARDDEAAALILRQWFDEERALALAALAEAPGAH